MADEQRPPTGAWRTYLELASGLGETSRTRVRNAIRDLIGKGNATAEQLRAATAELLAANAANREALGKLIKVEVDRALGRIGLATMDEVNELTARVRDLERQLREARDGRTAVGAAPARMAKKTVRKAAPAKATPTTAVAKKAAATKAVPTKAVAKKAVAKKAVAKKAVAKKAVGRAQ